MIAFVQPFSLMSQGGGSRILRALLACEHPPVLSIDTGVVRNVVSTEMAEIHISKRFSFGRLERTRFHVGLSALDGILVPRFEWLFRRAIQEHQIRIVHLISQGYEIVPVVRIAREMNIPLFLSVHDDISYTLRGHPWMSDIAKALGEAWRLAQDTFVISEEIGVEYSRRYGARSFRIVTDGLTRLADFPKQSPRKRLHVYFMGLFHYAYCQNMRALLDAMKIVRAKRPDWEVVVTCRCNSIFCRLDHDDVAVNVLPFTPDEGEIQKDLASADILYMPLPFQEYAVNFGKFSMSTKMITYLGSGLPILYHGPRDAAACNLLAKHEAAAVCTSLVPEDIVKQLFDAQLFRESIVSQALALARKQFMLVEQQNRFWQPILNALEKTGSSRMAFIDPCHV